MIQDTQTEVYATTYTPDLGNVRCMREWLSEVLVDVRGCNPSAYEDILLAAGEGVANAIKHGSVPDNNDSVVVVELLKGVRTIEVRISDCGTNPFDVNALYAKERGVRDIMHGLCESESLDMGKHTQKLNVLQEYAYRDYHIPNGIYLIHVLTNACQWIFGDAGTTLVFSVDYA